MRFSVFLISISFAAFSPHSAQALTEYTVSDEFDGCDHGQYYELDGGWVLECLEYTYFYEYRPQVIADGNSVLLIGERQVSGKIHSGTVIRTNIAGAFEGCEFERVYRLTNGLIFQCLIYDYNYSYMPDVTIFVVSGRDPVVMIDGNHYDGQLYRAN